jgi:hypothetical protein
MNKNTRHFATRAVLITRSLILLAALFALAACAAMNVQPGIGYAGYQPDYYAVTATAHYRPVDIPGTQRRVAQDDAENDARRQIMAYAGSMQVKPGQTVNDIIARNSRIRAKVLDIVRTSELVDWKVVPECGTVQVWMRVDLNRIREMATLCP